MLNRLRSVSRKVGLDTFLKRNLRYPILDPLLERLYGFKNRNRQVEDAIVISGTSRGGTTWLAEILNTLPRSAVLWEPLNSIPPVRTDSVDNKVYIPPDAYDEVFESYLNRIFKAQYLNFHMTAHMSIKELLFANTYIIKFCRANRLLPWITSHFQVKKLMLLIRHPCAVVASQLKHGAWDPILKSQNMFPNPGQRYLEDFPEVKEILDNLNYPEEKLAADWALDYLVPITYGIPQDWLIVTYEELISNGTATLGKIFGWLGVDPPPRALEHLHVPSRTVSLDSNVVRGGNPIETWRNRLSPEEIERILKVVNGFGIYFYSHALEPDYEKLHRAFAYTEDI